MDVTPYLLSRYADGQATPDEAAAVAKALAADETLAAEYEDLRLLGDLFGHIEAEEITSELEKRLCALRPVEELERFEVLDGGTARDRRPAWRGWAVAAAAVLLGIVGLSTLMHRPDVVLHDVTRLSLAADGSIAQANRSGRVVRRAGDTLATGAHERISFLLPDRTLVVLMPGSRLTLGDAAAGELLELGAGTVLCNVRDQEKPRRVRAAGFVIHTDNADFGVRVEGEEVKAAGASAASRGRVTVTVSRGVVEVGENGARATVEEFRRLVWRRGEPAQTTHAAVDPTYLELMREPFRPHSREVVPGYFTGERGVTTVSAHRWRAGPDRSRVLVLTDGGREAVGAEYLVLWARATEPTPLRVTRVRPLPDRPGFAEAVAVETAPLGTAWTVVSVPLRGFRDADGATTETRRISAGKSRLMRLELKPAQPKIEFELRSSLWAERPPAELPEVVR